MVRTIDRHSDELFKVVLTFRVDIVLCVWRGRVRGYVDMSTSCRCSTRSAELECRHLGDQSRLPGRSGTLVWLLRSTISPGL